MRIASGKDFDRDKFSITYPSSARPMAACDMAIPKKLHVQVVLGMYIFSFTVGGEAGVALRPFLS